MRNLLFTLALIFGLTFVSLADEGGLFKRGPEPTKNEKVVEDQQRNEAPLGSGIAVLLGLGGCYALSKAKKQD